MTDQVIKGRSIVLLGRFNPPIFQPAWFVHFGLLPDAEAKVADNLVVTSELTTFNAEWLSCTVTSNRAQFSALTESEAELRDLVMGAFEVLASTPIEVVGLNTDVHISARSAEAWHELGHRLVPKEGLWDDVLERPGMLSLKVQGQRPDDYVGMMNVTVEPSARIQPGVFVGVNDHFDLRPAARLVDLSGTAADRGEDNDSSMSTPAGEAGSTRDRIPDVDALITSENAMKLLDDEWQTSLMRADTIVTRVASWLN